MTNTLTQMPLDTVGQKRALCQAVREYLDQYERCAELTEAAIEADNELERSRRLVNKMQDVVSEYVGTNRPILVVRMGVDDDDDVLLIQYTPDGAVIAKPTVMDAPDEV